MRAVRVVLCSGVIALGIAAAARAPYTPRGAADAVLRFSWRMNVTAQENCRTRTQQELDALPVHMRTPQVCTRDVANYRLITRIGDNAPDTLPITRGGVKGDRPLFVSHESALPPGPANITVELQRTAAGHVDILARMDTAMTMVRGRIQLVTLDGDGRLVLQSSMVP